MNAIGYLVSSLAIGSWAVAPVSANSHTGLQQLPQQEPQQGAKPPPVIKGEAKPNAWFKVVNRDLGTYFQHEKAKGEFQFENPNDAPVTWSGITGSCTCAAATIRVGDEQYRLTKSPQPNTLYKVVTENGAEGIERVESILVPPGAEGVVEVEMDVHNTNGKRQAYLDIHTTDKVNPMLKLQFEAVGTSLFQIEPQDFNLGKMNWKEQRDFTFRIKSPVEKDFEITGHDPLPEGFAIETDKAMEGELAVWTVKGTFGPLTSERTGGGIIKLKTDVRGGQPVELRVHASVEGPLTMEPGGFLSLGLIRKGKGATKSLTITPTDDFDLQVESLELSNLSVDKSLVTVRSHKDGNKIVVELEVSADAPPGKLVRGDVLVKLNHPASPERKILFNGFVR